MIIHVVILLSSIPFLFFIYQRQRNAVHTSSVPAPVVQFGAKQLCCPKVYLYDPADVLARAQKIHGHDLKLTSLDPLNTDNIMFRHLDNVSIPENERISLLSDVLRWLPDVPNRPLTRADKLFEDTSHPGAMLYYSKDYIHTFHLRLTISGCVVTDPAKADLFIVPISIHTDHPYGKKKGFQEEWNKLFGAITDFQQIFQHFTPTTAHKHVIFSSSFGHSRHSVGLWSPPYNDPNVKRMQRVALGSDHLIRQSYGPWLKYVMHTPDNVISAPFSTLLTYPHNLLNISAEKSILVSSFFEFHGKAKALRQHLNKICESSPDCWSKNKIVSMQNITRSKMQLVATFLEAKTKSTYCLEPEGDWPTRQSMVQDVLLTCIPVFFTHSYVHLWSPFWGNFIQEAAVELDGASVLRGEINVIEQLQAIPAAVVHKKQQLLRRHREQLLYLHMDDYMSSGDNFQHQCSIDASNLLLQELLVRSGM